MNYATAKVVEAANELLDREDRRLQALVNASSQLVPSGFDRDGVSAMSRALTYVVCGGVLEKMMRDLPDALAADVLAIAPPRRVLPLPLLSILEGEIFRRCGDMKVSALNNRVILMGRVAAHSADSRVVEDFAESLKLADGSTIGTNHFQALWGIMGLPGYWWNHPLDAVLVEEIREKRNDVAHWLADPVDTGRSRSYKDLRAMIERLQHLLDHVYLHLCDWLDRLQPSSALSNP